MTSENSVDPEQQSSVEASRLGAIIFIIFVENAFKSLFSSFEPLYARNP